MLLQCYLAHKEAEEGWVILPVSAVDAYYGKNSFSKKWKSMLHKDIFICKES